jgi:hypothetical protein
MDWNLIIAVAATMGCVCTFVATVLIDRRGRVIKVAGIPSK